MTTAPKTIAQYIAGFPPAQRKMLAEINRAILAVAPTAEPKLSYGMPAYKLHGRILVYFAGHRAHVALYPILAKDSPLAAYKSSKATARFPLDTPLPIEKIKQEVRRRAAANAERA